ncbi:MAG TPA: hypothetical protein VG477_09945, partial [Thermoanaerobaculia bacterium]|nr:hypothetical protein [Thermoanaerobaculia bacterium]
MARTMWMKVALFLLAGLPAAADQLELLSKVPPRRASDTPSGQSWSPALSADGRYAAFHSTAVNVVPGQIEGNRAGDVFLYDRVTERVTLVSQAAGSPFTTADGASSSPAISADGRWVAFVSEAGNLVAGQQEPGPNTIHVYLWDRVTGTTTLVSRSSRSPKTPGNALSFGNALSADGRWVAFVSFATDLVEGQTDGNGGFSDVFLFDRVTGRTTLVSRAAGTRRRTGNDVSELPSISADGRYVAYRSAARDIAPGVSEGSRWNGFVYDRVTERNAWVGGVVTSRPSVRISANGEYVGVVRSRVEASEQHPHGIPHLYLVHRPTGQAMLVSHASGAPGRLANGIVEDFVLSADASWVAFTSNATNHVAAPPGTPVGADNVFLFERPSRQIRLVSRSADDSAAGRIGESRLGDISADGRWIVFLSTAIDLTDGEPEPSLNADVFLHDRSSGENTQVSSAGESLESDEPVISADGGWVAFTSFKRDLVPGKKDFNASQDVFLYSRTTGELELASRRGAPSATPQATSLHGNLSADGRYAVFTSDANNLAPGVTDTNNGSDVFLYDQTLKTTTLVSRSAASPRRAGNGFSAPAMISADGRFVVFYSQASDLVPGQVDTPPQSSQIGLPPVPGSGLLDVFLFDRTTGTTALLSHTAGSPLTATNSAFQGNLDITPDGTWILFGSDGDGLIAGQGATSEINLFLYERASGAVTLVSRGVGSPTEPADASASGVLSDDGRFIAFATAAANLGFGEPPLDPFSQPTQSIYLFDRVAGTVTRVAFGLLPDLSAGGQFLAFLSYVNDSGSLGAFLHDRVAGTIQRVSPPGSTVAPEQPVLSADGRYLFYTGFSVQVFDRTTGETRQTPIHSSFFPTISPNGRWVAFVAETPLPEGGAVTNVFLWDRTTGGTVLVSRSNLPPHAAGNGDSAYVPDVTDGGRVLFTSRSWNLVPGDFNQLSVPH